MLARLFDSGTSRAHHAARRWRLLGKFAFALAGAALLSTFLFVLAHLNDALKIMR